MRDFRNRFAYFSINLIIFIIIDHLNMPFIRMNRTYGSWLVIVNILLSIVMSGVSTMIFSDNMRMLESFEFNTKGENYSVLGMVFALVTYGCTPCVISFFANFGIRYSVYLLPFEGLPYKLIALFILIFGKYLSHKSISNVRCQLKEK